MSKKIEIEEEKLKMLLEQNEEYKKEHAILKNSAVSIMGMFGIMDQNTQKMKPEIASGEQSFIPGMLKSLGDLTALLMKANAPRWMGGGKQAEEELAQKFSFIKDLLPIINKHAN